MIDGNEYMVLLRRSMRDYLQNVPVLAILPSSSQAKNVSAGRSPDRRASAGKGAGNEGALGDRAHEFHSLAGILAGHSFTVSRKASLPSPTLGLLCSHQPCPPPQPGGAG